jgi:hypothetical protein
LRHRRPTPRRKQNVDDEERSAAATQQAATASTSRRPSERRRALSTIRSARWVHLAAILEAQASPLAEGDKNRLNDELSAWLSASSQIRRAPDPATRERIQAHLPTLDYETRQWVEFVLRTSA